MNDNPFKLVPYQQTTYTSPLGLSVPVDPETQRIVGQIIAANIESTLIGNVFGVDIKAQQPPTMTKESLLEALETMRRQLFTIYDAAEQTNHKIIIRSKTSEWWCFADRLMREGDNIRVHYREHGQVLSMLLDFDTHEVWHIDTAKMREELRKKHPNWMW